MRPSVLATSALALLSPPPGAGCGSALPEGPAREMRLRHIVLYQNGLGYFERTGLLKGDRLTLQSREREVDDVLKSVVWIEPALTP